MNKIHMFVRNTSLKRCNLNAMIYSTSLRNKSDDSDNSKKSDLPETEEKKDTKGADALNKLNLLLKQMVQEDFTVKRSKLDLARPRNRRQEGKDEKLAKKEKEESNSEEKKIAAAVKDVAETVGGNVKQTESELLMKLLNVNSEGASVTSSLSDIVKDMKIDRESRMPEAESRAKQVRSILGKVRGQDRSSQQMPRRPKPSTMRQQGREQIIEHINLFGEEPLNIFTSDTAAKTEQPPQNKTWHCLYERELKLAVTHPPANYFQEMIKWTEEGKIWKFPINNEQGIEEEQNVYFADHIFLEQHLDPWCPTKGPIRHFMELVCVGLSKNPYLTVEAKKEHIEWYKNYFEDKRKLLEEVGAFAEDKPSKSEKPEIKES